MVEDNKKLAARIDNSIVAANEEVNVLRGELVDTNRRLSLISEAAVTETGKTPPRSATAADPPPKTKTQGNNSKMPNNDRKSVEYILLFIDRLYASPVHSVLPFSML